MDIASLATNIGQATLSNSIAVAVAKKAMDSQKQQGAAALELLQGAEQVAQGGGNPDDIGGTLDVRG